MMEFNVNVKFSASQELLAALTAIMGGKAPSQPGKVAELKATPATEKSAVVEKVAEPAAKSVASKSTTAKESTEVDQPSGVSLEDIVSLIKEKVKLAKSKAVKALLDEFGVPKASELNADQYETFFTKLKAV